MAFVKGFAKMSKFKRVSREERKLAVLSESLKNTNPFFYEALQYVKKGKKGGHWDDIPTPSVNDWLWHYPEAPVSFQDYKEKYTRMPTAERNTLYIQPIGDFGPEAPSLELVRRYAEIFFQFPTRLMPHISLVEDKSKENSQLLQKEENILASIDSRCMPSGLQLKSRQILRFLVNNKPPNAHCVMALTMVDLFPNESWNFVFGHAKLNSGVAVFSFARYSPLFDNPTAEFTEESARIMLLRGLQVMVHETGHMFGVKHCVYFRCVMNGTNSLEESDDQPIHLCPACLRKFQHHLGFEVHTRYFQLLEFYDDHHLTFEAMWLRKRLAIIFNSLPVAEKAQYFPATIQEKLKLR